jgi:hypothetical protein
MPMTVQKALQLPGLRRQVLVSGVWCVSSCSSSATITSVLSSQRRRWATATQKRRRR